MAKAFHTLKLGINIVKTLLETPTDLYLLFKKFDGLMAGHQEFELKK